MPTAKAQRPLRRSRKSAELEEERRRRLRELRRELLAYYPGPMPRSRLTLMDVDPSTLHAYWSIDADYLAGLRRRHRTPAAPLVLRLYELKGQVDASRHLDFDLEGLTNNRYIHLWAEGRVYLGQVGLKTRRRFISVATSPPVRIPEIGPAPPLSPETDPEDRARIEELEAERATLIRSRYRELAEQAAAGGPEGLAEGDKATEAARRRAAAGRPEGTPESLPATPWQAAAGKPPGTEAAPGQAEGPPGSLPDTGGTPGQAAAGRPESPAATLTASRWAVLRGKQPVQPPAGAARRRAGSSLELALGLKGLR